MVSVDLKLKELMRRALPSGEIHVLSTDQTGRFVRAGSFNYIDKDDPALQAGGIDSLEAAQLAGFVRHQDGSVYKLTGAGFELARRAEVAEKTGAPNQRRQAGGEMAQLLGERWQISAKLREGGQAETFLVLDTTSKSDSMYVAKRLKNPKRLPRFEKEIEAIRSINHPHVLRLVDADTTGPKPFLISEYCERGSLDDCRDEIVRWDRDRRMGLFTDVCSAIAAAHEAGIVHRDLKPSNVFLRKDDTAVVGDFGLCYVDTDERITETSEAIGARYYMAPELAEGRAGVVAPSADVYSLGKLLYWLMTGRIFDRERHREGKYNLHNFFDGDTSIEHVLILLDKMIVERPSGRLKNAMEVLAELPDLRRLMRGGYPPLSIRPGRCFYCGNGIYRGLGTDTTTIHNFGLQAVGSNELHIFLCENCGHVLMFRPDMSKNATWLRT